ncbi:ung protein, partial [Ramicandelaber brevisporus]
RDLLGLEWDSIGTAWLEVLAARYFLTPKFLELKRFLKQQHAAGKTIFPPAADLYSWSRHTDSPADVRVVIMGQDPYHGAGQAHGLCFSVKPGVAIPPSLRNMYKELDTQYPAQFVKPAHGHLVGWATQGVLLLNATLTVESGKANSHSGKGWEQVTTGVVEYLGSADRKSGIVFMLWGGSAKVYKKFIDKKK